MSHRGKHGRPDYGHKWRQLVNRLKRHQHTCWLCGNPIDLDLPPTHPDAFNADHIESPLVRPDLALTYSNLRASHRQCNQQRQHNRQPATTPQSRHW